jgi:hypothetical protein
MTFDPHTNRIPQGLLTADEKAALETTGGTWEFWDDEDGEWHPAPSPRWHDDMIYRAALQPKETDHGK